VLTEAASEVGRKPLKKRSRRPEEALTHSVNHWIRVEALAILHEGEFSAGEVARMLDEDVKVVRGHIKDLYDSGCIEFAGYKPVSGTMRRAYRALVLPVVGVEAYGAMSLDDRHDLNGAVVQGLHAESVCSYRNRKMDSDENLCFVWQPLNLDDQGKRELLEHLIAAWEGAKEIEAGAVNRMAESGENGFSSVAAFLGFERDRSGRPEGGYHRPGIEGSSEKGE
jgi:DNA-binding transcriptional ArsR family regulator